MIFDHMIIILDHYETCCYTALMRPYRADWGECTLAQLLGSTARARVLACLLLPGARPMHTREIERECGLHYSAVQRELKLLERAGLVEVEDVGRTRRYHVNTRSPLIVPLRDLVRQAVGVIPMLRQALDRHDIELAFVFGSLASGQDRPDSDVDVMVVGHVDPEALSDLIAEVRGRTGRDITEIVYEPAEFRERLKDDGSFVSSIVRRPLVFLKGDDDALRGLAASAEDKGDRTPRREPAAVHR